MDAAVETRTPPSLDIDPYSDAVLLQPEPFFETLRETGSVVRLAKYGVYATGRLVEGKEVLSDYTRFTTTGGVGLADARKPGDARALSEILEVDPPIHTSTRSTIQRLLSPSVIKTWRAKFEDAADRLVLSLRGQDIEAMSDLAEAFVYDVFPKALGIRFEPEAVRGIGVMMFNQSGPKNSLYHAAMAGGEPYLEWLNETCRRENVVSGTVAENLFLAENDGLLRPGVAVNMVRTLVRGGTDSTIAGLGALLKFLATDAYNWQRLKSEPAKLRIALDEAIRLESPFHVTYRTTIEATELGGYALAADTKIAVFLGAANCDPRAWSEPQAFDLNRRSAGTHLSFGTADHNCVGQMLARLESESLVGAMLKNCETVRTTGPITYRTINQMRMIDRLPIRLD